MGGFASPAAEEGSDLHGCLEHAWLRQSAVPWIGAELCHGGLHDAWLPAESGAGSDTDTRGFLRSVGFGGRTIHYRPDGSAGAGNRAGVGFSRVDVGSGTHPPQ